MKPLTGKVAAVTGASRGVAKGIALGLGEAGATVYITVRTLREGEAVIPLPGTLLQSAEAITQAGGEGIPIPCDPRSDAKAEAVFRRVQEEQGRLDILVNNVWGGYEYLYDGTEFWKEKGFWTIPLSRWDAMFAAGVRAHCVASVFPGLVRTEAVLKAAEHFDLSNSESPQFIGRSVAALAADPRVLERSGQWLICAELAQEYGFSDIDGRQPTSLHQQMLG